MYVLLSVGLCLTAYVTFSFSWGLCNVVLLLVKALSTGPRSAVGNMSGNRCESDCRSRGREFNPGPVPYFRGD